MLRVARASVKAQNAIVTLVRTRIALAGGVLLMSTTLPGHAQLPAQSRTIYRCEVNGKIACTDKPCLGAKRLDVVPTRGVDKL